MNKAQNKMCEGTSVMMEAFSDQFSLKLPGSLIWLTLHDWVHTDKFTSLCKSRPCLFCMCFILEPDGSVAIQLNDF